MKTIHEATYGELLGVVIVGPHATDLIGEAVVALDAESTIETVADGVAPHPTLAEGLKEAGARRARPARSTCRRPSAGSRLPACATARLRSSGPSPGSSPVAGCGAARPSPSRASRRGVGASAAVRGRPRGASRSSACSRQPSSSGASSPGRRRASGCRRTAPPPRSRRPPPLRRVNPIVGPGPELVRPALDGLVPYEPGKPVETVQRELGLERVVKLASNEGPFGPFPEAIEAIERALAGGEPLPGRRLLPAARGARRAPRRRASRRWSSPPARTP